MKLTLPHSGDNKGRCAQWILESGRLTVMGAEWMEEVEKARKKAEKLAKKTLSFDKANAEAKVDALGNVIEEKLEDATKDMSDKEKKKELKNLQKQLKDGRKKNILTEDEILDLEDKIEALQA